MRGWVKGAAALFLFVSAQAWATDCVRYYATDNFGARKGPDAFDKPTACAVAVYEPGYPSWNGSTNTCELYAANGAYAGYYQIREYTVVCEEVCQGVSYPQTSFTTDARSAEELCVGGCKVEQTSSVALYMGGKLYGDFGTTGEVCADSTPAMEPADAAGCISTSTGSLCLDSAAPNCGTVNGESVCLDAAPAGECTFTGDGGYVCIEDATAAPPEEEKPVDTAGSQIPATAEINSPSTGSSADYWDSATVSASEYPGAAPDSDEPSEPTDPSTCDPSVETCDEETWSPPGGERGEFDGAGIDADIEARKGELSGLLDSIRAEGSGMIQLLGTGGALPCDEGVQAAGATIRACVADYTEELSILASAIFFGSLLLALVIVLR